MKVYLLILHDRHDDLQIRVYSDPITAVEKAEEITKLYNIDRVEDLWYRPLPIEMLFARTLSNEGDSIWVEEKEVE
jgi:hypothetical protein